MKVQLVGTNTIYGKIALELQEDTAESPLKYKLRHLAKIISNIGYVGAFLVFFSYLFSNIIIQNNFNISLIKDTITNVHLMSEYLISAITLAVTIIIVSVPEGLPMMVALVLSTNMKKMIKLSYILISCKRLKERPGGGHFWSNWKNDLKRRSFILNTLPKNSDPEVS